MGVIDEVRDRPTFWFLMLDAALSRGDYEEAARDQRELLRLGVRVIWPLPPLHGQPPPDYDPDANKEARMDVRRLGRDGKLRRTATAARRTGQLARQPWKPTKALHIALNAIERQLEAITLNNHQWTYKHEKSVTIQALTNAAAELRRILNHPALRE